jgi:hypothetical protein
MLNWLSKLKDKNKKSENVHYLGNSKLPVDRVLETAHDAGLESVTIVGWNKEGKLFMATSYAQRKDILWDMQVASREILQ